MPGFSMRAEVMHLRLVLESVLAAHQEAVEETDQFAHQRELRYGRGAPWRNVRARAVIPGTEQQPLRIREREEPRDRSVHITGAVAPARDRQNGDLGLDPVDITVRAAGPGGELRVVGRGAVAIEPLACEVRELEVF